MFILAPLSIIIGLACGIALLVLLIKVVFPRVWAHDEKVKNFAEVAAFLCAGAWALSTFYYAEKIKPRSDQPEILVKAVMEEVGRDHGSVAVRVTVNAHNIGKTNATVMAAFYNVEGFKVGDITKTVDTDYHKTAVKELDKHLSGEPGDTTISKYANYYSQPGACIHSSNLLQGWDFGPGDEYSRDIVFYVSEADYDLLKVNLKVYVAKDPDYTEKVFRQWIIDDKGEISAKFFMKSSTPPCNGQNKEGDLAEVVKLKCTPFDPNNNKEHIEIRKTYGMNQVDAISALSLWQTSKEREGPKDTSITATPTGEKGASHE